MDDEYTALSGIVPDMLEVICHLRGVPKPPLLYLLCLLS